MPIHDWTRVQSGTFHDFHQGWTIEIRNALNRGILPAGYFAMVDQRVGGPEPDVLTLQTRPSHPLPADGGGAVVMDPPKTRQFGVAESAAYARRANRLAIRHHQGRVVAMIEIVSPGNKDSQSATDQFVRKAVDFLDRGIHFLMIDLFPPTTRDPHGLHHLIWAAMTSDPFEEPPLDKPLAVASYDAGPALAAYVEPLAIGDPLPTMPLFLEPGTHVRVPLEDTYATTWAVLPAVLQDQLQP